MTSKKPQIIIVTKAFDGLGYAKLIQDAGYPVLMAYKYQDDLDKDEITLLDKIGEGMVERQPLKDVWKNRDQYRNAYWIFDQNHWWQIGEKLHEQGFKVLGGRKVSYDMENDREFGVAMAKRAGLDIPETLEFKDPQEGIDFLEQNEDKAYVFKPNSTKNDWSTYPPESVLPTDANLELRRYLASLPQGNNDGYILQERKSGIETNYEVWLHNGKPYFAFLDLECKRKLNDNFGGLVGGAQDICRVVPLDAQGVQETVGKIAALPDFKDYTGFIDINFIFADRHNYFLEYCARFGYPSHCTLFTALAISSTPEILIDAIDGTDDFAHHFREGFGAGITLYSDKKTPGQPIYIPEQIDKNVFHYDSYREDNQYLLVGNKDIEVAVVSGNGYSPTDAAEEALDNAKKVIFPNKGQRTDLARDNYIDNPIDRYIALEAIRYNQP